MRLTLEKASLIVDQALVKARPSKFRPMCVAVLDDGGHIESDQTRRRSEHFTATDRFW